MASGGPPPNPQQEIDQQQRTNVRLLLSVLAASVVVVLAVTVPMLAAQADRADAQRARYTTVTGVVVDGRGEAPRTSELRISFPTADGARQEWMRTSTFRFLGMGADAEVAYPNGHPEQAELADECGCLPDAPFPAYLAGIMLLASTVIPCGLLVWSRTGGRAPDGVPSRSVHAWWGGPASGQLRLYDEGELLGAMTLSRSYRRVIADGDEVSLTGGPGRRGARIATRYGPIPGRFVLTTPASVARLARQRSSPFARSRPDQAPIGPAEAARLDRVLAVTTGLNPLVVLVLTFPFPGAVRGAALLALAPVAAGFAGKRWAALARADGPVPTARPLLPPPPAPPEPALPPPPPPTDVKADILGDHKTVGRALSWLGRSVSIGATSILALLYCILAPILAPAAIIAAVTMWRGGRPRKGQPYSRPGLPAWLGFAVFALAGTLGATALQLSSMEVEPNSPLERATWGVLAIAGAVLAVRIAFTGMTVGDEIWMVRNLRRWHRIPASEVTRVEHRPDRGPLPAAGAVIHRTHGDPVIVGRFTLSRVVANRLIADTEQKLADRPPPPPPRPEPDLPASPYAAPLKPFVPASEPTTGRIF